MEEDDLRPVFEEFGEIFDLAVIRDKISGLHRGGSVRESCQCSQSLRCGRTPTVLCAAVALVYEFSSKVEWLSTVLVKTSFAACTLVMGLLSWPCLFPSAVITVIEDVAGIIGYVVSLFCNSNL